MNKIYLIILIVAISTTRCGQGEGAFYDAFRKIINNTSYSVEIGVFNDNEDTIKYFMSPTSILELEGLCVFGITDECYIDNWDYKKYGYIIFNQEKIQRFTIDTIIDVPTCNNEKMINGPVAYYVNDCGYKRIETSKDLLIFEYQITEEDFNQAEFL